MPNIPTSNPKQFYQAAPLLTVPDVMAAASYYQRVLGFEADTDAVTEDYGIVWRDSAAVYFAVGANSATGVRISSGSGT